jgi:hypothetical protein
MFNLCIVNATLELVMSTNPWEMGNKKYTPSFWLMYGFYKWTYKDIYMYKNK